MNRFDATFTALKSRNETALVGFVSAGDPNYDTSLAIIDAMATAGLDVLELGIPFSDPTADGPMIQRSSQRAIEAGMSLSRAMDMVAEIRAKHADLPIVLFSYYNPILAMGQTEFYARATAAGADGALIVDLPPEEAPELTSQFAGPFPLIHLVAPTTSPERQKQILASAGAFVYLISRTGVTGSGEIDVSSIGGHVAEIREATTTPVCVGFGISTPDHVRAIGDAADGVVIGSAFERIIEDNLDAADLPEQLAAYVRELKAACK